MASPISATIRAAASRRSTAPWRANRRALRAVVFSNHRNSRSVTQRAIPPTWRSDDRLQHFAVRRGLGGPFAFGLPTGRAKQVRPPMPPRSRLPQIASDRAPFVEGDDDGIVGAQRLRQAIAARQVVP